MKIGVVGSRQWVDRQIIFNTVFKDLEPGSIIVSGGQPKGADGIAKHLAMLYTIPYREWPPAHFQWNKYCVLDKTHYGKPYNVVNFFTRNTQIAEDVDIIYGFVPNGIKSNGTLDTCRKAFKLQKQVYIVSETEIKEYKK